VFDAAGKQLGLRTLRGPTSATVARIEKLSTKTGEELAVDYEAS
jgi:hypothetical protein